jgi:hypothetical protein
MSEKRNVCSSGWKGVHGSTVTLENYNTNPVKVNDCGDPGCPFAFSRPPSGFSVPGKVGSNPGTIDATLQNVPKTYCYCTVGCPNSPKQDTNPKTVIIS